MIMIYYTKIPSPLGILTAAVENGALAALWLPTQRGIPLAGATEQHDDPVLLNVRQWLEQYFLGNLLPIPCPLAPKGTNFQKQVWDLLLEIPYGQTVTYGELAKMIATASGREKMSAQAVGQAVGANPIAILIPCHRVLGAGGKLTGYTGGIDKKIFLLELEYIAYKQ